MEERIGSTNVGTEEKEVNVHISGRLSEDGDTGLGIFLGLSILSLLLFSSTIILGVAYRDRTCMLAAQHGLTDPMCEDYAF